jgi:hypothetical protein
MGVWKADEEQKVIRTKKQPTRDSIEATLSAIWRLPKSFSVQVIVTSLLSKDERNTWLIEIGTNANLLSA